MMPLRIENSIHTDGPSMRMQSLGQLMEVEPRIVLVQITELVLRERIRERFREFDDLAAQG
ncbi:Uncharacterised protein [Paenibacillus macerans]|uniref:Uncharacterized protein n=1 Tax=Paenibacillus macerans TaxID=44252 RepID=A0A090YQE8_PAEMA|nr:hypothetical protein DJ90_1174 [Paenibacillus macerans]SUD25224.1 Uncharacterised protein [Paenibacillus macerans]